jgi:TetR/AcrR family transcriptional repressor of uid operon
MAATQKHRIEQRDKVLLAARQCFVQHGFHATGMAEIAKACRMSVGNIYHYFRNKNAIVQAITDETRSQLVPALRRIESHAAPVEGIIQIIVLSVRELCRDSNARLWLEIQAEAPRNKLIRKICLALDQHYRDTLKRLMQRAIDARQLPPGTDLDAASLWLLALLDGAIARLSVEPDIDIGRALDTLAQSIRRGLCGAAS